MAQPLIATKLNLPLLRPRVVGRLRLRSLLDRGQDARLTLISAPAGFGKTTLLADWFAHLPDRQAALAWLSLDAGGGLNLKKQSPETDGAAIISADAAQLSAPSPLGDLSRVE